jgi:hypothetical protein
MSIHETTIPGAMTAMNDAGKFTSKVIVEKTQLIGHTTFVGVRQRENIRHLADTEQYVSKAFY